MAEPRRAHGGVQTRELRALGLDPEAVLDLSVNVNPWGPHPAVVAAMQRASLGSVGSYPQPWAAGARAALASLCDVDEAEVVVGHGSTELIWSAVGLLGAPAYGLPHGRESSDVRPDRPMLIVGPTFSEPMLAARAFGVPWIELRTDAQDDFALDLAALSHAIERNDAAAVYLCQPNNPDGGAVPTSCLREICEEHRACLFLLDQAFLSLSSRHAEHVHRFGDNVLVVRSLTKEHALPGLRAGYALGAPALIEALNARRPSWMVSSIAEAAIIESCKHQAYVAEVRAFLLHSREELAASCRALGLRVIPSTTSFFLLQVGNADQFRLRLLSRHGIAVRSCASFGLPDYVRVAACGAEGRTRLLAALRAELAP